MSASNAADGVAVADNHQQRRYEAFCDGELAGFLEYRTRSDHIVAVHTEVDRRFEGRGVGGRLASFALDDARERGLTVTPACPFVADYVRRHPEYADLVKAS